MYDRSELMKVARRADVDTISLQAVWVGPGSEKPYPPMATQVCRLEDLSPVNSQMRDSSAALGGVIKKLTGSNYVEQASASMLRPVRGAEVMQRTLANE